jgi:hypothetical protein
LAAQEASGLRLVVVEGALSVVDWAVARTKREETAMMLNFILIVIDCRDSEATDLRSHCKKERRLLLQTRDWCLLMRRKKKKGKQK